MQVAAVEELHAQLSNVAFLDRMHLDRAAQQYRDWGNHTEAVDMQVPSYKIKYKVQILNMRGCVGVRICSLAFALWKPRLVVDA